MDAVRNAARLCDDVPSDNGLIDCIRFCDDEKVSGSYCDVEKARILQVSHSNPDNPWYGTAGGPDTSDRVFLLSLEEVVCRYFGDSGAKLFNRGKNQRYWFERKDENNARRMATLEDDHGLFWWWWIRTPGRVGVKAVYIHGDGNIGIQGNNILKGNLADGTCTGGVRPAMWVRLDA